MRAAPDQPELHIRFGRDGEVQREAYASEFAAFWRDEFGTTHFSCWPDSPDTTWEVWDWLDWSRPPMEDDR